MKHTSGLSITLAAIWVLSGCAILEPRTKEDAPTNVNVSEISDGYALLYDLVSKEKQSSLLSIIKKESPELKSLLERISETSKATAKELETLTRINPPLNLKVTHLPRIEQAATPEAAGFDAGIWNSTLKVNEINVETFKGVVQLSGFVRSQADIDKAIQVARGVAGVKAVKNDMRLK